jgi:hypothetical protein
VNCTVRKRFTARAARVGDTRIAVEMAMVVTKCGEGRSSIRTIELQKKAGLNAAMPRREIYSQQQQGYGRLLQVHETGVCSREHVQYYQLGQVRGAVAEVQ